MASEMMEALMALCQEKHIDELYLLDRLEQSLAKSYAEVLHLEHGAKVTIDRTTGNIYVYKLVPVGEPDPETGEYEDFEEVDVTPKDTSRVAAMHAKSEINAIVRNAARQQIYEEFQDRVGDIITGTVLQTTPDFTILKIREGVEAELPHFDPRRVEGERNETPRNEHYRHGDRIKALIIDVRDPNAQTPTGPVKGEHSRPSIVVSRTHPGLIRRLFELEVPEVYDGVVEVESIAREPGNRSKVAVSSLEPRLDPVGACVGPKGSRVRTVVAELRGERVDVVPWSDDPATRVANALSPAKVTRVIVDPEHTYATVIVPDDQLSLAIGKEGQNARLAARLTGYHIDIKSESLARGIIAKMAAKQAEADSLVDAEEDARCAHVDENGNQCRNHARPGSRFCGQHAAEENGETTEAVVEATAAPAGTGAFEDVDMDAVEVSDDPDSLI
ncbi:transcription termination factor NusA [Olsenella sp. YH-ols2217]|uniref:Transcription termination/antitermination protein NusA n=1 Tax=Kribbibacterium absianum TaxID=3044210 RepID=A0ABT6ZJ80_9ACTN|nr:MULTISPECIES: transcription termination factor NusA [unclassified Olsenella]MDJ1121369.1 transcription termination factor NusA [Olsenella sp. YH-ols2216]MDJ1128859.1 transcription termination factor NusA [Olsenella sp. YH-ols2217]